MATPDEIKLIEKMVRAKVAIEGINTKHSPNCMVDLDPDYHGPCTCGAAQTHTQVSTALKALSF
ncbi:TPA: hypothetical protein DDX30_04495 [Candidatus Wolfebacteria bacterium]|nr:hypothetical protein [Candidatus Wolfebacteria bacterium]